MTESKRQINRLVLKIILAVISVSFYFTVFFWAAGRINWIRGWIYIGIMTFGQTINSLYIRRTNPGLLTRRGEIGNGTKLWDKVLLGLFGLTYLGILLVAALDERFKWSEISIWLWPAGCVLYIVSLGVTTWAMSVNPHFEKTVRIQKDRGHTVIDTGPYSIVRHPGYVGVILGFILSTPLLLGSWLSFYPAFLSVICIVIRTALEDRTLQRELSGYTAYAKQVRFRLLPGIW